MTRGYLTRVSAINALTPHFTRFTFTAPELRDFGTGGLDQRIKLMMPLADGSYTDVGLLSDPPAEMMTWYRTWRELPDELRNPIRTYTVRAIRPKAEEIDVDVVLHGTDGPASAWASAAQIGDELLIIGPDGRSSVPTGGIEWHPGTARSVMLAGDETAAPAICAILETLDESYTGHAFIEVPTAADALPIATRSRVEVRWLPRDEAADSAHGALLDPAVRAWGTARAAGIAGERIDDPTVEEILWDVPGEGVGAEYAWLAGEAGVITTLRRHLVRDLGIDRKTIAFMGYWRIGRAEGS